MDFQFIGLRIEVAIEPLVELKIAYIAYMLRV